MTMMAYIGGVASMIRHWLSHYFTETIGVSRPVDPSSESIEPKG